MLLRHGIGTAMREKNAPEGFMHRLAPLVKHRAFIEGAALLLNGSSALE